MATVAVGAQASKTTAYEPHPKVRARVWLMQEVNYLQHAFGLDDDELANLLLDVFHDYYQPDPSDWEERASAQD